MVLILLVSMIFGVDLPPLLGLTGGGMGPTSASNAPSGPNTIDVAQEEFVAVVLADTEEVRARHFAERGGQYANPRLVLFSGQVQSACGMASAAVGPFYCPGDRQVYLDTDFFRVMKEQLGARGEFPRAHVIAHEVGHHVQNLIGVMEQTARLRPQLSEVEDNAVSVRVQLLADCLARVRARSAQAMCGTLEPGDIRFAMDAPARIGDDTLQRQSQGHVVPDSFTHGSSAQRQRWFYRGFENGAMEACDIFSAAQL